MPDIPAKAGIRKISIRRPLPNLLSRYGCCIMEKQHGVKFFIISLVLSLFLLLALFWSYLPAIVLAFLVSSVSYPLYVQIRKFFNGRETFASLCMILIIFLVLVIPSGWFVRTLSNETFEFYKRTSSSVSLKKIQEAFESNSRWALRIRKLGKMTGMKFTPESIENMAASIGKTVGLFLYKQISSTASNILSLLINFFLMMLTVFYLFRDGWRLKDYIKQLLPVPKEQLYQVVRKFQEMGKSLIIGNGLSGIVQGVLGGFGFFFFGMPSPFLWGTIISFMALLPIVGASIVFVPGTIILILQGKAGTGIGFLAYNLFYSSLIEYFIKPRIIGKGMQMNSLLVFIGIIGGIKLFGILGIIYGPLIITIFLTLAEIYRLEYKEKLTL